MSESGPEPPEELLCKQCEHEQWDHFLDDNYDGVIPGSCNVEGCGCEGFEA